MKEKTNKLWSVIIDTIGYGMGISLSINTTNILINILKYGKMTVRHTWWTPKLWLPTLLAEILFVSGTTVFFIYKFIRNMIDREKLSKLK